MQIIETTLIRIKQMTLIPYRDEGNSAFHVFFFTSLSVMINTYTPIWTFGACIVFILHPSPFFTGVSFHKL